LSCTLFPYTDVLPIFDYYYHGLDGSMNFSHRYLENKFSDTVIRDARQYSIIEKALSLNELRFETIVSPRNPFGLNSDLFNPNGLDRKSTRLNSSHVSI